MLHPDVVTGRGKPVAEAAVDRLLGGPQRRDRLPRSRTSTELRLHHPAQQAAAPVRREHADDGHPGTAQRAARDGELEREGAGATDDRRRRRRRRAGGRAAEGSRTARRPPRSAASRSSGRCRRRRRGTRRGRGPCGYGRARGGSYALELLQLRVLEHQTALRAVGGEAHRDDAHPPRCGSRPLRRAMPCRTESPVCSSGPDAPRAAAAGGATTHSPTTTWAAAARAPPPAGSSSRKRDGRLYSRRP